MVSSNNLPQLVTIIPNEEKEKIQSCWPSSQSTGVLEDFSLTPDPQGHVRAIEGM